VESLTPDLARRFGVRDTQGVLVDLVADGSRAANAGLRTGDVIVEADRQPLTRAEDLTRRFREQRPGSPVLILVHRDGLSLFVALR
jgi:S1-C subfamily serine protease